MSKLVWEHASGPRSLKEKTNQIILPRIDHGIKEHEESPKNAEARSKQTDHTPLETSRVEKSMIRSG